MSAAIRRALRAAARTMSTRALATSSLVPFPAPRVTVAYTPKAIDAEIRRVFFSGDADTETSPSSSLRLIGFDIEHKPETRKGAAPSVHLVQITSPGGDECLLLHVAAAGLSAMTEPRARREVPHLVRLLGDARVVAAGVGVGGDLDRLRRSHATLFCSGAAAHEVKRTTSTATAATPASSVRTLDSQAVHLFYHPEAAGASVARLAAEHALASSAQSKSVTMSDWSLAPLAPRQVAYAAEDASLSFRIAQRQFERYAPAGATFTEWAACFLGVDTPLAMDARVAEILKNPETSGVPEAMLAAFRRHHSAMTRLRRLRLNASRWRAMTVALAKHAANAPGFTSAVSTLDVVRAAAARGGAEAADEGDASDGGASDARMRVRYEHSRLDRLETSGSLESPTFACAATAELRIPRETDSPRERSERATPVTPVTLVFEGRGRSKRAAKDAAARGLLAAVRSELDGVWMCSNAAKWAAESLNPESPNDEVGAAAKELARRLATRTPLRCALGCAGAGAALAGPRDRTRVGVAQPAHFEDEAGWASCALRRRRRERSL